MFNSVYDLPMEFKQHPSKVTIIQRYSHPLSAKEESLEQLQTEHDRYHGREPRSERRRLLFQADGPTIEKAQLSRPRVGCLFCHSRWGRVKCHWSQQSQIVSCFSLVGIHRVDMKCSS